MGMRPVSDSRTFASLGPMLLARKGTAKPAMRVQLGAEDRVPELGDDLDELARSQSDLGWNDMGDTDQVVSIANASKGARRQQRDLERKLELVSSDDALTAEKRRAAFTLRLDAERHLKLRIASTLGECSAQSLVTEALDKFLDSIPELDALAAQMMRRTKKA